MANILHLLILLASCGAVDSQCSDLKVINRQGDDVTATTCIKIFQTPDCMPYYEIFDQSDVPAGFPISQNSVKGPANVSVELIDTPYNDALYPGLSVTWQTPVSGRESVVGYLLVWYVEGNPKLNRCRLIQVKPNDNQATFISTVKYVRGMSQYTVRVYGLPQSGPYSKDNNAAFVEGKITTADSYNPEQEPSTWQPYLWIEKKDGSVFLYFTLSPKEFGITQFSVFLVINDGSENILFHTVYNRQVRSSTQAVASVELPVPMPGSYKVIVWPEDEFRNIGGKCRCWSWVNNEKTCENTCGGVFIYLQVTAKDLGF